MYSQKEQLYFSNEENAKLKTRIQELEEALEKLNPSPEKPKTLNQCGDCKQFNLETSYIGICEYLDAARRSDHEACEQYKIRI